MIPGDGVREAGRLFYVYPAMAIAGVFLLMAVAFVLFHVALLIACPHRCSQCLEYYKAYFERYRDCPHMREGNVITRGRWFGQCPHHGNISMTRRGDEK